VLPSTNITPSASSRNSANMERLSRVPLIVLLGLVSYVSSTLLKSPSESDYTSLDTGDIQDSSANMLRLWHDSFANSFLLVLPHGEALSTLVSSRSYLYLMMYSIGLLICTRLIVLLVYGDLMRASWFFVAAVVMLARCTVKTSSSFCQSSGFLIQYGTETSGGCQQFRENWARLT
jgi:hypothetical protein